MNKRNTSLEFGLRALITLSKLSNDGTDIERLLMYDYMLTNSGEFNRELPSVHAETPYKYSKLLVKRNTLKEGINLMLRHGLLTLNYNEEGIIYKKNKYTQKFLDNIDSVYKEKLEIVAEWICKDMHIKKVNEIEYDLKIRIKKYGIEFYEEGVNYE